MNRSPTQPNYLSIGPGSSYRPDRTVIHRSSARTIMNAIFTRIAVDVSSVDILHVRTDDNGRYMETIDSPLNNCLTVEANIDQTGRAFVLDAVMSMLDEGHIALTPIDTDTDPTKGTFDIYTMRVGKVTQWYPRDVEVDVYNDQTGRREKVTVPKTAVAIIENPFYSVMNEPNSTLRRLVRKLDLLDMIDERNSSPKLDLIIQLPYATKSTLRKDQAAERLSTLEQQLAGSKYGIGYIDGTEHITQLNRPVENNLQARVEYLTNLLYSQLGFTQAILDGTADEKTMLNYQSRVVEVILSAFAESMRRVFLTKTARTQHQTIMFFQDPFKLVPVSQIAEIADKMTRNEIMTSNEIRQILGMKPSSDPRADELRNKNLNQSTADAALSYEMVEENEDDETVDGMTEAEIREALADLDDFDQQLDDLEEYVNEDNELRHYASPYYDPVKAHEYYEAHKKLKGRTSLSGLNEKGREAARYVKNELTNERKQKVSAHKEQTNSRIEQKRSETKSARERFKTQMQSKIDRLKRSLEGLSREAKAELRGQVNDEIKSLREENRKEREQLSMALRSFTAGARSEHKTESNKLREEYDSKYIDELDRMKNDPEFKAVKKGKSGKKSSSSKKKPNRDPDQW